MEQIQWLHVTRGLDAEHALKCCRPGGWLVVSVSSRHDSSRDNAESLAEFLAAPSEMLFVLDPQLTALGPDALAGAFSEALGQPGLLTLFVPPAAPPPVSGKNYGPVLSFAGPVSLLNEAPVDPRDLMPDKLCFWALRSVIHGADAGVIARECSNKRDDLPEWTPAQRSIVLGQQLW